jgi:hypothetical protein
MSKSPFHYNETTYSHISEASNHFLTTVPTGFFDLPRELRDSIYADCMEHMAIEWCNSPEGQGHFSIYKGILDIDAC